MIGDKLEKLLNDKCEKYMKNEIKEINDGELDYLLEEYKRNGGNNDISEYKVLAKEIISSNSMSDPEIENLRKENAIIYEQMVYSGEKEYIFNREEIENELDGNLMNELEEEDLTDGGDSIIYYYPIYLAIVFYIPPKKVVSLEDFVIYFPSNFDSESFKEYFERKDIDVTKKRYYTKDDIDSIYYYNGKVELDDRIFVEKDDLEKWFDRNKEIKYIRYNNL